MSYSAEIEGLVSHKQRLEAALRRTLDALLDATHGDEYCEHEHTIKQAEEALRGG